MPLSQPTLSETSTLREVLSVFPDALFALERRYRLASWANGGSAMDDTLGQVLRHNSIDDCSAAIDFLYANREAEQRIQVTAKELAARLQDEAPPVLLDVRDLEEHAVAKLPDGRLLTRELLDEVSNRWPKDRAIVTYCHHGIRSMRMALHLMDEGFDNVQSLAGGIDGWALEVDSSVVRY